MDVIRQLQDDLARLRVIAARLEARADGRWFDRAAIEALRDAAGRHLDNEQEVLTLLGVAAVRKPDRQLVAAAVEAFNATRAVLSANVAAAGAELARARLPLLRAALDAHAASVHATAFAQARRMLPDVVLDALGATLHARLVRVEHRDGVD